MGEGDALINGVPLSEIIKPRKSIPEEGWHPSTKPYDPNDTHFDPNHPPPGTPQEVLNAFWGYDPDKDNKPDKDDKGEGHMDDGEALINGVPISKIIKPRKSIPEEGWHPSTKPYDPNDTHFDPNHPPPGTPEEVLNAFWGYEPDKDDKADKGEGHI